MSCRCPGGLLETPPYGVPIWVGPTGMLLIWSYCTHGEVNAGANIFSVTLTFAQNGIEINFIISIENTFSDGVGKRREV